MTKAELIENIASETQLSKRQVSQIVEMVFSQIRSALQKGDRVALTPFGSFVVRARKAREGRNPMTGAAISIAARNVPAFVPGTALKAAVSTGRNSTKKAAAAKKGGRKR